MKKYLLLLALFNYKNLHAFEDIEREEEISSYEILFEKNLKEKNTGGTAHMLIKSTKPLFNKQLVLNAIGPYCLKNGCIGSVAGPFLENNIFVYFFTITGPHKNIFKKKDVVNPSFPYALNFTIPKRSLRSVDGDVSDKDVKLQIIYTSKNWNVSFQQ